MQLARVRLERLKVALTKKGLRLHLVKLVACQSRLKVALYQKGLRQMISSQADWKASFESSPVPEGIKTRRMWTISFL